ncbi:mpv17-like protein [Anas acuta]|uniref:mpv17-like protein n=1 Tax=Anas acuta TaxID=28680 RepID=UPI0035C8F315
MAARWAGSVLLYAGLTAAGDAAQRRGRGQPPDWAQTRRVALLALTFHGNLNYVWLRALERALPGRRPAAVLGKVLCDQLLAAPVAVGAFYTGMSILQRKEDIFSDCKNKFWNTYKTGLMYWPFVQPVCCIGSCKGGSIREAVLQQKKTNLSKRRNAYVLLSELKGIISRGLSPSVGEKFNSTCECSSENALKLQLQKC